MVRISKGTKMTKISKQNLRVKSKKMIRKFSMSKNVNSATGEGSSSISFDDKLPMLPPTSDESSDSEELSPIEEERRSTDSETSRYVSSFLGSSTTSISSISEVSSYKNIHDGYMTPNENDFFEQDKKYESDTSQETIGESIRPMKRTTSVQVKKESHEESRFQQSIQSQQNQQQDGPSHSRKTKNELNETKKESKQVIKHSEQKRQEYRESTVVEVEQDVPFEAVMHGISEHMRHQSGGHHNLQIVQGQAVDHLFGTITDSIGLNRSKTISFMMMNFSLIAANANQLKHLLEGPDRTTVFYVSIGLLIASTIFQVIAKIISILCEDHFASYTEDIKKTKSMHKVLVFFAVLIAITNLGLTGVTFQEIIKELGLFNWWKWE